MLFRLALSCQNQYEQAVEAYKKALELEPDQESYKNKLKIAEDKVKEFEQATRQQVQQQGAQVHSFFLIYLSHVSFRIQCSVHSIKIMTRVKCLVQLC